MRLPLFFALLLLVLPLSAQQELYYDQFDWGSEPGNPGDLNTGFWSGPRERMHYEPQGTFPPQVGFLRLGNGDQFVGRISSGWLGGDFPTLDYQFYTRLRLTDYPAGVDERNAEVAFRSDGGDGYMLTLDGGQDVIRLRRQGGGFVDLVPPVAHDIEPGESFYVRVQVVGEQPAVINAEVATDPAFEDVIYAVEHSETEWVPRGGMVQVIGFSPVGPYSFDCDYFSIGAPGYAHPVESFARKHFTDAPPPPVPAQMGNLVRVEVGDTGVVLHGEGASTRLTPVAPGVVQVEFGPAGNLDLGPAWGALGSTWPTQEFVVQDDGTLEPLTVEGTGWRVEVERTPVRLRFVRPDGTLLTREPATMPTSARDETRQLTLQVEETDGLFGLGQTATWQNIPFNRRGHTLEVRNNHFPPSYLILPYWVTQRGFGVFVDNPAVATLDLAASDPTQVRYRAPLGELRYYVYFGPTLRDVARQHADVTGKPALQPRWTLGNIQSRYGYQSFDEIDGIIAGFRGRSIPLDGVILDLDWFGIETMGNLDFQQNGNWPQPASRLAAWRQGGVRSIPITEPQISGLSANASEVNALGLTGRLPDNSAPYPLTSLTWITSRAPVYLMDFTNPAARDWWKAKHRKLIQDYAFDGFWQDLNEPEGQTEDMLYHAGPAALTRNVAALLMNRTLAEAMQEHRPGHRPFIMSRSGFAGMQRHGAGVWSGDVNSSWYDFSRQPRLAVSMGLAGVPMWNSDVGGFNGFPSAELYTRWCQFAFFNPVYRPHANHSAREPWAFGPEAEQAVTALLRLRYRLLPYLYNTSRQSYDTGAPIMRPLLMDWPDDSIARGISSQFMYGDSLMAAPVLTEGATIRQVYLPAGEWHDWWTGQPLAGSVVTLDTPLSSFPLLVRAPAIIPMGPELEWSDQEPLHAVTLRIHLGAPGTTATGHLYEDDGLTTAYQGADGFARTEYTALHRTDGDVLVTLATPTGQVGLLPDTRQHELELPRPVADVLAVVWDATQLPRHATLGAYDAAPTGWWNGDGTSNFLRAKGPELPIASAQTILIDVDSPASAVSGVRVY